MSTKNKLKILHVLSQRPDSTGSGIYVQAMIREATAFGYDNFLVAGFGSTGCDDTGCIEQDKSIFVNFYNADVSYQIPGMSDVMPYESTKFCDLSEEELCEYENRKGSNLLLALSICLLNNLLCPNISIESKKRKIIKDKKTCNTLNTWKKWADKGVKSTLDPWCTIRRINSEIKPEMIKNKRIKKNIEAMKFELSKGQE